MDDTTKRRLTILADKYETADFMKGDPSQFMHRYADVADQEVVALTAACLSFGRRELICHKVELVLRQMEGCPCRWVKSKSYKSYFSEGETKFYRFYSHDDMICFFDRLNEVLCFFGSLGRYVKLQYDKGVEPLSAIAKLFNGCKLVPQGEKSACKRMCMFLRWMVRQHSSVDLGVWSWFDACKLVVPLDTHVMQEAEKLQLVDKARNTMKSALEITEKLKEIWPDDPVKGDFALFGLGMDEN